MDLPTRDDAAANAARNQIDKDGWDAVFEMASDLLAAMVSKEGHGIDTARAPQMAHDLAVGLCLAHMAWASEDDSDEEEPAEDQVGYDDPRAPQAEIGRPEDVIEPSRAIGDDNIARCEECGVAITGEIPHLCDHLAGPLPTPPASP